MAIYGISGFEGSDIRAHACPITPAASKPGIFARRFQSSRIDAGRVNLDQHLSGGGLSGVGTDCGVMS